MNSLVDKFGDQLAVIGVPSNQFGHQANEGDEEFLMTLKHVRPGNGFEFKGELMARTAVNGAKQQPLFKWMKESKPIPHDTGAGDTKGNGCNDIDALVLPRGNRRYARPFFCLSPLSCCVSPLPHLHVEWSLSEVYQQRVSQDENVDGASDK